MMISGLDVRYRGEIADMNLIRKAYQVNDYIEAIEERDRATGEAASDVIQLLPIAEREIFPRLYRIVDKVLERIGISFDYEIRLMKAHMRPAVFAEETGPDDLFLRFGISPEDVATFDDDELSFLFGKALGWEIWGFGRFTNLERRSAASEQEKYEEGESVLPLMGNAIYKRWNVKAKLSADRIGAIAAGSFEASVKALLREDAMECVGDTKDRLLPLKTEDLCIPGIRQFLEFEERRGKARPSDGLLHRIRALCFFCAEWYSPMRNAAKLETVDEILDNDFESEKRKIEAGEEQTLVYAFLDQFFAVIRACGRSPSYVEWRALVRKLWEHTDDPSEVLSSGWAEMERLGKRCYRKLTHQPDRGIKAKLYSDLCEVLPVDGRDFSRKREGLLKVARDIELDEKTAISVLLSKVEDRNGSSVDPLAIDQVARIRRKLNGRKASRATRQAASASDISCLCRYADDIEGERILREVYNADSLVQAWLSTVSANNVDGERTTLLKGDVRLCKKTSPRVFGIVRDVCERLGMTIPFEVYCRREGALNAHAHFCLGRRKRFGIIVVSVEALEQFDDKELAFIIGHEMGHLIFNHGQWGTLEKLEDGGEDDGPHTVLPQMGDIVYREWQQKQEISCDRVGAIATGEKDAAIRAMIKIGYGLSERNFTPEGVDTLLSQLSEIKDREEVFDSLYESHPLVPLRIKALSLFCDKYMAEGFDAAALVSVDNEIARYYEWLRKYPRNRLNEAGMRAFVDGGMELCTLEGTKPTDGEVANICLVLNALTGRPEDEFVVDVERRRKRLGAALKVLRDECDEDLNKKLVERLVAVALEGGSFSERRHGYLVKLSKRLGFDDEESRRIISAKIAEVGFRVDKLLEAHVGAFRDALNAAPNMH